MDTTVIPLGTHRGFDLLVRATEEDISMRHHFITQCGWTEHQYRKIKDYEFFQIEVEAWWQGEYLGSSFLGAMCYKGGLPEAVKEDLSGYGPQLKDEAVEMALETLSKFNRQGPHVDKEEIDRQAAARHLSYIIGLGGNQPNERLMTASGPNDAAQRGLWYCSARHSAFQLALQLDLPVSLPGDLTVDEISTFK